MPVLTANGIDVHFTDQGEGDAVVLVHGFAASVKENWERAGWIAMLTRAGRRVVAVDLRGHGESAKPTSVEAYTIGLMAQDVLAVVEHLDLRKPDLIGFSLGARVVLELLRVRSGRFLLGVLCGVGSTTFELQVQRDPLALAQAMEAASADDVQDDLARRFRLFAEGQGQDLAALAACARGLRQSPQKLSSDQFRAIGNEILVVAGSGDELAGSPQDLARLFPQAVARTIPGCGHMDCLTQPMLKAAVMDFLAGVPA